MRLLTLVLGAVFSAGGAFGAQALFDKQLQQWTLRSDRLSADFRLTRNGEFQAGQMVGLASGDVWQIQRPQFPVLLQAEAEVFVANEGFQLVNQYSTTTASGVQQYIVLRNFPGTAELTLVLEVYDGLPVLRYHMKFRNLVPHAVYLTRMDLLPWLFAGAGQQYTAFRVNQWSVTSTPGDFQPSESPLDQGGAAFAVNSGAHAQHCGWIAVRDANQRGVFAGWEFDGREQTTVQQLDTGNLQFSSNILDLNHPVAALSDFETPSAFLGFFHGDWDEAGYQTQRFAQSVLAKPIPGRDPFPYVSWDSWGYGQEIDEATLRRNAELAASMGAELFTVDLGWARSIGDWHADPDKFPHGLDALADYVHSLGMKFGLHFALAEADPASPVLQDNPDWTSSEDDGYFGAKSLCLSNQATRDWIVREAVRLIDEYHVDWILQDGENMVKKCNKTTHTHDPNDSNFANAVDGLNAVIAAIQTARPNVYWENCEDGGNMMTFNMVRNYVTSITNDASGSFAARQAVYGATYPFPPRYTERYMPQTDGLDAYATHSYMFGGPWALMNRLADLSDDDRNFLTNQIQTYKSQRSQINDSKIFHIRPPESNQTDVIQSYNPSSDSAVAVISRPDADTPQYIFQPRGLNSEQLYTVHFDTQPDVSVMPGAQLMQQGVRVELPTPYSSAMVRIDSQ